MVQFLNTKLPYPVYYLINFEFLPTNMLIRSINFCQNENNSYFRVRTRKYNLLKNNTYSI